MHPDDDALGYAPVMAHRIVWLLGMGLVGLATLSACGDDEVNPPPPDTPLPAPDLDAVEAQLRPIIDAQCEWIFGCCNANELALELGPFVENAEDCSNRIVELLRTNRYVYSSQYMNSGVTQLFLYLGLGFGAGRVEVDAAAVDACAADIEGRACNPATPDSAEYCVPTPPIDYGDACDARTILVGQQQLGEACTQDVQVECAEGLTCIEYGETGVCIEALAEGDSCFTDYQCPYDLVCDFTDGTCATPSGFGEPCTFTNPDDPRPGTEAQRCEQGLVCDPGTNTCSTDTCIVGAGCNENRDCPQGSFCVQYECGPLHEVGEGCYEHEDCASELCDFDTQTCTTTRAVGAQCSNDDVCESGYCDFSNGQCAASVANGSPCPSNDDSQCADGWCDLAAPTEPTCVAYAAEGQPCPLGRECDVRNDVQCVAGTCEAWPFGTGVACGWDGDCESELCHLGVCATPAAIGEACAFDGSEKPCAEDAYCDAEGVTGTCVALKAPGELCEDDVECYGGCYTYYNHYRCESTPSPGQAYCGG